MNIKIVDNCININIYELFSNLSNEDQEEVARGLCWEPFITNELIKDIKSTYSRKSFNSVILKIREAILQQEDFVPKVIIEFAGALLDEAHHSDQRRVYWERMYWDLYHHYRKDCTCDKEFLHRLEPHKSTWVDKEVVEECILELLEKLQEIDPGLAELLQKARDNPYE